MCTLTKNFPALSRRLCCVDYRMIYGYGTLNEMWISHALFLCNDDKPLSLFLRYVSDLARCNKFTSSWMEAPLDGEWCEFYQLKCCRLARKALTSPPPVSRLFTNCASIDEIQSCWTRRTVTEIALPYYLVSKHAVSHCTFYLNCNGLCKVDIP